MWRKFCRHMVDIKNDYFDKDRLEDMVVKTIIEDEDADRYLIDVALQLSQQAKVTTEPNTTTNSQHNLTNTIENMDLNFFNISNSSCQNTSTIHHSNLQCSKKCYVAILHHNILNLLSNFNTLQTFPKKFHDNVLQPSQRSSTQ